MENGEKPMRSYIITVAMAIILLTACSSSRNVHYLDLPNPANQGKAQIVLYYPHSIFWSGEVINLGVDGNKLCALKTGEFLVKDINPDDSTNITATQCSGLGRSLMVMKAGSGKKYYIRIHPKDNNTVADIIANYGLASSPVDAPKQAAPLGDFDINIIEEQDAIKELVSLRLCEKCK